MLFEGFVSQMFWLVLRPHRYVCCVQMEVYVEHEVGFLEF